MTTNLSGGGAAAAKKPSKFKIALIILGAVFIGGPLVVVLSNLDAIGEGAKRGATLAAAQNATDANAAKEAESKAEADAAAKVIAANWDYGEKTDAMSNSVTRWGCLTSTNEVKLDFPYKNQATRLCVRHGPKGSDVYVKLPEGGQFNCSIIDGCRIRIKFDDGAIQSVNAVTGSDGSNDIVFLRGETKLVAALKTAKAVIVEAEFFQAGVQQMTFNAEGFDAPKAGFAAAEPKKK
ncbi:MAG: hypothetical protein IIZ63_18310 [Caulobacteraceae bacterium]|nr:hypothetical protein [Caulobacteraceae bacterium]